MRGKFMEIVYCHEKEFLISTNVISSHKQLEDKNSYYHILDKYDGQFSFLSKSEPKKLKLLDELQLKGLSKTQKLIFNEIQTNEYLGYSSDKSIYSNRPFAYQLHTVPTKEKLSAICIYFQELNKIIQDGHQFDIVFPNLFAENSIAYDIKKETISLIGIDALQVQNMKSIQMNPSLHRDQLLKQFSKSTTYYDEETELFSKNLDELNLINQFFILASHENLLLEVMKNEEDGINPSITIRRLLKKIGLDCENTLYQYLLQVYQFQKGFTSLDKAIPYIEHLESNYELTENFQFSKHKKHFL